MCEYPRAGTGCMYNRSRSVPQICQQRLSVWQAEMKVAHKPMIDALLDRGRRAVRGRLGRHILATFDDDSLRPQGHGDLASDLATCADTKCRAVGDRDPDSAILLAQPGSVRIARPGAGRKIGFVPFAR